MPRELDMARAAVESLVRQVAPHPPAQQAPAAAPAPRAAAAAARQQEEAAAAAAMLRAEVEALRAGLAEARGGAAQAAEELRRWVGQQLQAHRAAVEEAVQVGMGTWLVGGGRAMGGEERAAQVPSGS